MRGILLQYENLLTRKQLCAEADSRKCARHCPAGSNYVRGYGGVRRR